MALGGNNSYRGITNINQGLVTLFNGQALGSPLGGTVVANGATLQLQGNITIGGEPLTLLGSGLGTAPTNVPLQWFATGPAPINNGQTLGNLPVSGRVTSIVADPSDANVLYIATAGGGAWKTTDDGKTWQPLFDNTAEAQVTVIGNTGTFSLSFNGSSTPASGANALPYNATAPQVQAALNALPGIGGVGGFVSVTATPTNAPSPGGNIYTIDYGGTLSQANPPPMSVTGAGVKSASISNRNPSIFAGAIAIAPSDPRILYLGTGETDGSSDSYYGTGVYKSTDSGRTWSLLIDPNPPVGQAANPLFSMGVSQIVVDPVDPNIIYVASSNQAIANAPPTAIRPVPGVYRYIGDAGKSSWFNLTAVISVNRATMMGQLSAPPNTPGPDDDFQMIFPQTSASWTSLNLVYADQTNAGAAKSTWTPTLYAALGNPGGSSSNAVFRCQNPNGLTPPIWYVGDGGIDTRSMTEFPAGAGRNGNIKLAAELPPQSTNLNQVVIYAAIAGPAPTDQGLAIEISADGGHSWAAAATLPNSNYTNGAGNYDLTLALDPLNANHVLVAGYGQPAATGPWQSTDGGATWNDVGKDAAGNGPHDSCHAATFDAAGDVLFGTDGGVFMLTPAKTWNDLNGTLAITQFNSVAANPIDTTIALGGSQNNGTELYGRQPSLDRH